jgi:hypothetical protein
MRRGTTPIVKFELPFGTEVVKTAKITFMQNNKIILEKKEECVVEGNSVSVTLTQEESFLFNSRFKASVQLRVVAQGDVVLSTDVQDLEVEECLDSEVL